MSRQELLYPAQADFPDSCRECPMLVGMIEDGELPTTRRLNDKERQHVQQTLACWVVDSCPGPEIEEGEHGAYICTAIERFAPEEEF